ncbi:hypothetical protein EYC80_000140 [Monilinia laxa]|uniref:NADH dehydrogenase [ubiquinone] 1 beta subcomplex subunit 2 n=1 Tax=Monilinia laxa TaxID=61186 RepID=A0A5N6K9N3_MONLA|nr:hypothetical protein EYC80_000140 [Monilinia laxa]
MLNLTFQALILHFTRTGLPKVQSLKMAQPPPGPGGLYRAPPIYRFAGTALGASMWFFLMYRAKKDGPVLLGWKHPWDH